MGVIGGNKEIITEGLHYYMDPGNREAVQDRDWETLL